MQSRARGRPPRIRRQTVPAVTRPRSRPRRSGQRTGRGGLAGPRVSQEKRSHRSGEAVWILPEEQMAQLGEGHQPGSRDAVREQLAVARVDDPVRAPVQDQRACPDARLPEAAGVACSGGRLSRQGCLVRWAGALQLDQTADKLRMVLDGPRRQGVFDVAAPSGRRSPRSAACWPWAWGRRAASPVPCTPGPGRRRVPGG